LSETTSDVMENLIYFGVFGQFRVEAVKSIFNYRINGGFPVS
jgi:hypothetical protein